MRRNHKSGSRFIELVILIALPILFDYLLPVKNIINEPYSYIGIVIMIGGLLLAIRSGTEFRNANTGYRLSRGASELMTSGPFQYSRNPMYLGMLCWLIGLAVLLGSLTPFLFPAAFFLVANFIMIPFEERSLERQFGVEYNDYKDKTRRWL